MKAMRAHQFGGPEQLRFEDAPEKRAIACSAAHWQEGMQRRHA